MSKPRAFSAGALKRHLSWVIILIVALSAISAFAQLAGKGTILGTVTDPTGAVVPAATIIATNVATNVAIEKTATDTGAFSLPLDPGLYNLSATAHGFKTTNAKNVNVNALETVSVNLVLELGTVTENVVVTDAVEQLDTGTAQVTATMEQAQYAELPLPQAGTQRRATDFVSLMPGVNSQPSNGGLDTNTGVVNGSGSRGAVSSVYIEGMPLMSVAGQGDPRFIWTAIPMEAINQMNVTTVGYGATYEGQGVLNYDIKKGGSKFHGSVYEYFRNTSLDTWGYLAPWKNNPLTGKPQKPAEHQNEYGFSIGGPAIREKLFFFSTYEGYKLRQAPNLQPQTNPTLRMLQGDFSEFPGRIYDPASTRCANSACTAYIRDAFPNNVIPANRLSPVAKYLQKFLPPPTGAGTSGNYVGGLPTGRNNWMNTNRVDYNLNSRHSVSGVVSFGHQSTLGGAGTGGGGYSGALSNTQNQAPAPYGSSQDFSVVTRIVMLEDTYTFSSHIINQFKASYGRYSSTGTSRSIGQDWGAAAAGIPGLPPGQTQDSFPTVAFAGTGANLTRWAGYSSNRNTANGTIVTDNVLWEHGRHSITIGGQLAWMQYNFLNNATGVNPLQLTFNSSETAGYRANSTSTDTATGKSYASFLLGAANNGTFTISAAPETGARFRAISPYVQDNWRITPRLTLNLGLRWDLYPSYREVLDRLSWMDPTVINPMVNYPGAMVYAGDGANQCHCRTNVKDYYKNFGPRFGFAYQLLNKTVVRGSFGIMTTHGNNVGGSATSRQGPGLLGYAASPRTTVVAPSSGQVGMSLWYLTTPYPSFTPPPFFDPTLGTYYTTASTASPQTVNYADPYYGGRAPTYMNWSFGFQHQLSNNTTLTATYVGSAGRFVYMDATNARGIPSNQLDPKWLRLGDQLSNKATAANLAAAGITAPFPTFSASLGTINQALRPFPQYNTVTDILGYVGTTSYNALEVIVQRRMTSGLTFMGTYTWSKSIDNSGTFRSGYDIPAQFAADGNFHPARSLDRSLSLSDIPHRVVGTAVYELPFGRGHIGGENMLVRASVGGWKISGIYQASSGAPLGVVMQSCPTNPSAQTCQPFINPDFHGDIMALGGYEHVPATQLGTTSFLNRNAFTNASGVPISYNYIFSTTARTAPFGMRNSGNYQIDANLKRTFPIRERVKLNFQIDAYNLTNHTRIGFANSSTIINLPSSASTAFGTAGVMNTSRFLQLAARVEF